MTGLLETTAPFGVAYTPKPTGSGTIFTVSVGLPPAKSVNVLLANAQLSAGTPVS
jgi:hypothetical protein